MAGFIPLDKTVKDFQTMLKTSALSGVADATPAEIIGTLRKQPIYDTDYVIREITSALIASNDKTNCVTGNNTEHVIVTKEKLNQILDIIRDGGMKNDDDE